MEVLQRKLSWKGSFSHDHHSEEVEELHRKLDAAEERAEAAEERAVAAETALAALKVLYEKCRAYKPGEQIINPSFFDDINRHLPSTVHQSPNMEWQLLFSLMRDGSSFSSFFDKCRGKAPTILIIKTKAREVFGAFTNTPWKVHVDASGTPEYYGTDETFLFKLNGNSIETYQATCLNNEYMLSSEHCIGLGGAGQGFGLYIGDDFLTGQTYQSDTFKNKPLTPKEVFDVSDVECWHFAKVTQDSPNAATQHGLLGPFILDMNRLLHDITGLGTSRNRAPSE